MEKGFIYLTISISCSSSRRCRIKTDSIMRRSSSVRWDRSGIGEATASARAAAEVDEAGDVVDGAVVAVPKAAMNAAAAATAGEES